MCTVKVDEAAVCPSILPIKERAYRLGNPALELPQPSQNKENKKSSKKVKNTKATHYTKYKILLTYTL